MPAEAGSSYDDGTETKPKHYKQTVLACKTKTMSLKTLKCSVELRRTAELGDNSLWVHHVEQHLSL